MATGEMHKGQMVCCSICSLRGQHEQALHVESLGQKMPPRKPWENTKASKREFWSHSRGVGGPRWPPPGHLCGLPGGKGPSCRASALATWVHPLLEGKHTLTLCVGQVISEESMGQKGLTLPFQLLHKSVKASEWLRIHFRPSEWVI